MKKLFLIALCIALAACMFTGCGEKKDTESTTTPTTQATQATSNTTQPTTDQANPTTDGSTPSMDSAPTAPGQESTEAPSTVAPNGGVDSSDARSGNGNRSIGSR